jgi:hypothetical protein
MPDETEPPQAGEQTFDGVGMAKKSTVLDDRQIHVDHLHLGIPCVRSLPPDRVCERQWPYVFQPKKVSI